MTAAPHRAFAVTTQDRIAGWFVIGAMLILLIGFIVPWIRTIAEDEQILFETRLDRTYGITTEAIVSLRGVTVGGVRRLALDDEGYVSVIVALSPEYAHFYREGSHLEIDSELGVSNLLNGAGLVFKPGDVNRDLLKDGSFLRTEIPQGITSVLDQIDVELIVEQIETIVNSVESIATGVDENQATLYQTIANLEKITQQLEMATSKLPQTLLAVESSLSQIDVAVGGVDALVKNSQNDLQIAIANTVQLTAQATKTLKQTEGLLASGEPAVELMPELMQTTDATLKSIDELSQRLNRSWIFGGRKKRDDEDD